MIFFFNVQLVRNGVTRKKIEGDKKTPKGSITLNIYTIERIEFINQTQN